MPQKERVSAEQVGAMRGVTITEVLGTDMKKHFDITSRFQVSPPKRFSNRIQLLLRFANGVSNHRLDADNDCAVETLNDFCKHL